jgi:ubiquinone/menaquinone biosynthesis C-methylase UbiE
MSAPRAVDRLYAVEISKHRLLRLAPLVLRTLDASTEKITRAVGTFERLHLHDASVDFCLLSQAFHHAEDPLSLLRELLRVLKPGGSVIVVGESPIYPLNIPIKWLKNVLKMVLPARFNRGTTPVYKVRPSFYELFPTNATTGDHYYRIEDYHRIFRSAGFMLHAKRRLRFTVFLAVKPGSPDAAAKT